MKIYVISDIHLLVPGETSKGLDTAARFDVALADLAAHHADADLCVLLGDLADHGAEAAYIELKVRLSQMKVPARVLIGNHDDRETFKRVVDGVEIDENGFVQSVLDTDEGRFIFLDTFEKGHVNGMLCEKRHAWLSARLAEAKGQPVSIFMHHPPFDIGMRVDAIKLANTDAFHAALAEHGDVRQIFAGHTHRTCSGVWRGIPFVNVGATHYNQSVGLSHKPGPVTRTLFPIMTAVALVKGGDVVVHHHDVSPTIIPLAPQLFPEGRLDEIIARGGRIHA